MSTFFFRPNFLGGNWNWGFGIRDLGLGIEDLGLGTWDLDSSWPTDLFDQFFSFLLSTSIAFGKLPRLKFSFLPYFGITRRCMLVIFIFYFCAFFLLLRLLLFTHFGKTSVTENLFPPIFWPKKNNSFAFWRFFLYKLCEFWRPTVVPISLWSL